MNLTLGTLAQLKVHLLNEALREATDFDATLAVIGRGIAARFEKVCDRAFAWAEGATYETNADRMRLVLPRFPFVEVTKIEVRDDLATGFVDQGEPAEIIFNQSEQSGLVEFAAYLGGSSSRLRLTYDGGYWFDDTDDASGEQPAGAALLPDDLHYAWLMQCEWVWANRDKLGVNLGENAAPKVQAMLGQLTLIPDVAATLRDFVRFSP